MRFVLGGLCRGRFGAELPARHLTPLPPLGTACSPALSDQPHGLGGSSGSPSSLVTPQCSSQGVCSTSGGRLAGVPLLLPTEADVSTRDQRKGNPCSQRFPGPSGSIEPSSGDPPLCMLLHPSAAKSHLQSLEYFWKGPRKINYGNSSPYSEK